MNMPLFECRYTYDDRGRVKTLGRTVCGVTLPNITYSYDDLGRLASRQATGRGGDSYAYNLQGWQENLLVEMYEHEVFSQSLSYYTDGTKVKTMMSNGHALEYRGGFVYSVSADGARTLESIASPVGRITTTGSGLGRTFRDLWFVRDRLGSVRAVVDITDETVSDLGSVILEESDYMPFGTRFTDSAGAPTDTTNRHRFAGKEEQAFASLSYIDFGARLYDPATARWYGDINKKGWPRLFSASLSC